MSMVDVNATLLALETKLLDARDLASLNDVANTYETATRLVETTLAASASYAQALRPIIIRLHTIANLLLQHEETIERVENDTRNAYNAIIEDGAVAMTVTHTQARLPKMTVKGSLQPKRRLRSKSKSSGLSYTPSETVPPQYDTLNASFMRRWLVANLHDPFPSKAEKEEMIARTNEAAQAAGDERPGLVYQQVMLWFINSRRRSGWTTFFRRFANSDKSTVAELVHILRLEEEGKAQAGELEDALQRARDDVASGSKRRKGSASRGGPAKVEVDGHAEAAEAREMWAQVVDWSKQGAHEKVGDWLDKVLQEAKENGTARKTRSSAASTEDGGKRRSKRRRVESYVKHEEGDDEEDLAAPRRDFSGASLASTSSDMSSVPSLITDRTVSSSSSSGPPPHSNLLANISSPSCSEQSPTILHNTSAPGHATTWLNFDGLSTSVGPIHRPPGQLSPASDGGSESGWSIGQLDAAGFSPPIAQDKGKGRELAPLQHDFYAPFALSPMDYAFDFTCVPAADAYPVPPAANTTWVPFMG